MTRKDRSPSEHLTGNHILFVTFESKVSARLLHPIKQLGCFKFMIYRLLATIWYPMKLPKLNIFKKTSDIFNVKFCNGVFRELAYSIYVYVHHTLCKDKLDLQLNTVTNKV